PGGHGLHIAAGAEGLAVAGEEHRVDVIPVPDILQGGSPQVNHLLAEAVELVRAVHGEPGQVAVHLVQEIRHSKNLAFPAPGSFSQYPRRNIPSKTSAPIVLGLWGNCQLKQETVNWTTRVPFPGSS